MLLPTQRRTIGMVLLLFGIATMIMSGVIVSMISSSRSEAASRFTEQQASCKRRLLGLGGKVDEVPGRLIWKKENLSEAPARLGEASVAGVLCPGWRLKTACVGTECPESNAMRIVLEPMNADKNQASN